MPDNQQPDNQKPSVAELPVVVHHDNRVLSAFIVAEQPPELERYELLVETQESGVMIVHRYNTDIQN